MFRRKVKIGLALGGGGARGFTHLGVIKAFEEFGITFDYIAGTSAGSLVGAFLASGMKFEQMYEISKTVDAKDIRTNKIPLMPSKTEGIENMITKSLGNINIEDLKTPFSAIAVDIKSAKEVCISKGNLAKAVAGSCCVPGVFIPVEFNEMNLCDGGLQNTIPADIPKYFGCDFVVAIDCNHERLYGTQSTKMIDVLSCSIRILMKSNAVKGYINADIVIAPNTKRFKSTATDGLEEMIEEGYKACIDLMPQIKDLFGKRKMFKRRKKLHKHDITFI